MSCLPIIDEDSIRVIDELDNQCFYNIISNPNPNSSEFLEDLDNDINMFCNRVKHSDKTKCIEAYYNLHKTKLSFRGICKELMLKRFEYTTI